MSRSRKVLTAGAVGVAALALMAASTSVTGAFFSEAKGGTITGTLGEVHVTASPTSFEWKNMMPGEPRTATVDFQNTGTGNQDFYLVFKNVPALHAFNNLGTYGEVHIADGNNHRLFDSANLQDGRHQYKDANGAWVTDTNSCGNVFAPAVPAKNGCWLSPSAKRETEPESAQKQAPSSSASEPAPPDPAADPTPNPPAKAEAGKPAT